MESAASPEPAADKSPAQPDSQRRSIAIAAAMVAASWLIVFFDPFVVPLEQFAWNRGLFHSDVADFRLPYLLAPVLAALYLCRTVKKRSAAILILIATGWALLGVGVVQRPMCGLPVNQGQQYCSTFEYDHGFVWHWSWPDTDPDQWCRKYSPDNVCAFQ
jgi:hypothetical protein